MLLLVLLPVLLPVPLPVLLSVPLRVLLHAMLHVMLVVVLLPRRQLEGCACRRPLPVGGSGGVCSGPGSGATTD